MVEGWFHYGFYVVCHAGNSLAKHFCTPKHTGHLILAVGGSANSSATSHENYQNREEFPEAL